MKEKREGTTSSSPGQSPGKKQERSHRYSAERHYKNFNTPARKLETNSGHQAGSPKDSSSNLKSDRGKLDATDLPKESKVSSRIDSRSHSKSNALDDVKMQNETDAGESAQFQKNLGLVDPAEGCQQDSESRDKDDNEEIKLEEEKKLAYETKQQAEERIASRLVLRVKNLAAEGSRPDEGFFKQLDSSMKKNTTFVKKLRTMTESQRELLAAEFSGLNLSKFIQEAVTALLEAKLKVADVGVAAYMCSLLHQRYGEFTSLLKRLILKSFESISCRDEEKAANVSRLRISLRLLGELVLDGVYTNIDEGVQLLHNTIQAVVSSDKTYHTYAPVILTIVRHCGEDLAGILPRKNRCWKEKLDLDFPRLNVVPADQQSLFLCLFKEYYESMAKHLIKDHKDLQNRERQNRQTIGLKGELPPERREAYEKAQKAYERLLGNTSSLAELLDEDMPDLPEDQVDEQEESGTGINIFTPSRGSEYDSETGLWEDEDTRTFYEDIRDLKVLVPQILFKDRDATSKSSGSGRSSDAKRRKERKFRTDLNLSDDLIGMDEADDDFDGDNYEQEVLGDDPEDEDASSAGQSLAAQAEVFFQKLPTCINRDFIDQAAEEFIMKLNTKGNRKKLVRALFTVNRIRLDLLPFYSRLVATLSPCLPDVAQDLLYVLKGDFRFHVRKKDQINIESKIKSVRFIGELTKFKVCPKAEALHCLKMLLEDFTHHNIEMACNLLETCGRYLYRSPESHTYMTRLLEQMMRKKTVQAFDSRQSTMIENAFYYCNPPERQKVQKKMRSPIHEYIRKLIYKDLSKTNTEKVLRQMRKLPWSEPETKRYVTKCLVRIWNVKFNNIRCAANMLAGLAEYHDDVSVHVIDGVLENLRLGMETNLFRYNQRRVCSAKFLGEMYNYQLVESDIIFTCLYSLITFGACVDMSLSELDPPDHLFRIRLVCTLLDTCGQYFDRGINKKKLDCFLVFFQCYVWQKKEAPLWTEGLPFPRDVEYMISDTLEGVRPKMNVYGSGEEAKAAAAELNKEYEETIKELSQIKASDGSATSEPDSYASPSASSPFNESQFSCSPSVTSQSSQEEEETVDDDDMDGDEECERALPDQDNGEEEMFEMDAENSEEDVHVKEGPRVLACEEDDEFKLQFEKMLGDSFQSRVQDGMKAPNVDIPIPMNLKGKSKKQPIPENPNSLNFVLMMKKGSKPVMKDLLIPLSSDLAARIHGKQLAERAEHEEMKRLVLDYNQRQEEELYNEMVAPVRPQNRGNNRGGYHARGGPPDGYHSGSRRGNPRLRSRDSEQHLFSPSNRR